MTFKEHFDQAPQVVVTLLDEYRKHDGWLSARKYPQELKPEPAEAGMIVERGRIVRRVFAA